MARTRDAVDTIKGYYYQFDYFILQIIDSTDDSDEITIEGIEDVDIFNKDGVTAVQCKYYSKTEYNHSVIAQPIRLMLRDFAKRNTENQIRYKIYGKYKAGHEKYPEELTVDFVKKNLFTYTKDKEKHVLHEELNLTDEEIENFLSLLDVNINAEDYDILQDKVINGLKSIFRCGKFEAEYYYYNNALRLVKEKATQNNEKNRIISKKDFLDKINNKKMLFDKWYLQYKGVQAYCKDIKKQYFTQKNISPYERFFLIECDSVINDNELLFIIEKISSNWSKLSRREIKPFCPYIYLEGISKERLINLKKHLQEENIRIWDGYDFLGADFKVDSIIRKTNFQNDVKLKIINDIENLDTILEVARGTKQIYQFYLDEPFYENNRYGVSYGIQISSTHDIIKMI